MATDDHDCEGFKSDGATPCSRTAKLRMRDLRLCHQHAQIAERDPALARTWKNQRRPA